MLTDWELWAVANQMIQQHGPEARVFVASRIGALILVGDVAGVAAWKGIARRVAELNAEASDGLHS